MAARRIMDGPSRNGPYIRRNDDRAWYQEMALAGEDPHVPLHRGRRERRAMQLRFFQQDVQSTHRNIPLLFERRKEIDLQFEEPCLYQVMIFMVHQAHSRSQPDFESYLLLPKKLRNRNPRISDEFEMHGRVTVISNSRKYLALNSEVQNQNVEVIEVILDLHSSAPADSLLFYPNIKLDVYTQIGNEGTIRDIFIDTDVDVKFRKFEEVQPSSRVVSAFDEGNLKFLEDLIAHGPDIKYKHPIQGTFLHFAVECEETDLVNILLKNGCSVNDIRSDGTTALHLAAYTGNKEITTSLLNHDALKSLSVKMKKSEATPIRFRSTQVYTNAENATPLHISIENNHCDIMKSLLNTGADVDALASPGMTALRWAVECESLPAIKLILTQRLRVHHPYNIRAFYWSLMLIDTSLFNLFEEYGFSIDLTDIHEKALLHGAIRQNKVNVVDSLLKNGANVHEQFDEKIYKGTPLHTAAKYAGSDMIELLVRHGANINAKREGGIPPLYDAVQNLNLAAIKSLLDKGTDLNGWAFPNLCLHEACETNNIDILSLLLIKGVDANSSNAQLETPLFVAVRKGSVKMVEALIRYAADVNARSAGGRTPLHEACAAKSSAVVEVLLKNGANVNARRVDGRTPLFEAVEQGSSESVEALAKFNARVENAVLCAAYHRQDSRVLETILEYNFQNLYIAKRVGLATRPNTFHLPFDGGSDFLYSLERHALQLEGAELLDNPSELDCSYHKLEIKTMESVYIGESGVTFYDILWGDMDDVARYARNPEICRIFDSVDWEQKFPIYINILRSQFRKGLLRKQMLEQSVMQSDILLDRFGVIPDHIKELILSYLSMQDLGSVLNVCAPRRSAKVEITEVG